MNGNCIKFVNITDGSVRYLHASCNGISTLAVNPSHGLVAFGENGLNAKIFVYELKNLNKPICTIPGINFNLGKLDSNLIPILKDMNFHYCLNITFTI